jgi:hypothetical protein
LRWRDFEKQEGVEKSEETDEAQYTERKRGELGDPFEYCMRVKPEGAEQRDCPRDNH